MGMELDKKTQKSPHISQLEERHREGYEKFPVAESEFSVWEEEQEWGDE